MGKPSLDEIFQGSQKPSLDEIFEDGGSPVPQGPKPSLDEIFSEAPKQDDISKFGMSESFFKRLGMSGPSAMGDSFKNSMASSGPFKIGEVFGRIAGGETDFSKINPLERSFYSGIARTGGEAIAQIPSAGYSAMAYQKNLPMMAITKTAKKMGLVSEEFQPKYDKVPDWLLNNPLSEFFGKAAKTLNYNQQSYGNENAFTLYGKGDPAAAIDWTVNAVAENLPFSLFSTSMMVAGAPAHVVLAATSALAGLGMMKEEFQNPRLDELQKMHSLSIKAAAEGLSEYAGAKLFPFASGLFERMGVKAGQEVMKNSLKRAFAGVAFGPLEEGIEEYATQVVQGATDMYYRSREGMSWKNVFDEAALNGYLGAASGGVYSAGAAMRGTVELGNPTIIIEGMDAANADAAQGLDTRLTLDQLMDIKSRIEAKNKGMTNPDTREPMIIPQILSAEEVALLDRVENDIAGGNFHEPQEDVVRALGEGISGEIVSDMVKSSFDDQIREKTAKGEELEPNEKAYVESEQTKTTDIKNALSEEAKSMPTSEFKTWAKDRIKPEYKSLQELLDAKQLHTALIKSGDLEAAAQVKENVSRETASGKKIFSDMERAETEAKASPEEKEFKQTEQELASKYQELDALDNLAIGEITPDFEQRSRQIIEEIEALEKRKSDQEAGLADAAEMKRGDTISEPMYVFESKSAAKNAGEGYKKKNRTDISVEEIRKRNPWIKTDEQAQKIIDDVNTKPFFSLDDVIKKAQETKDPSQPFLPGIEEGVKLPSEKEVAHGSDEEAEKSIQKVVQEIQAKHAPENVRRAGIVRQLQEVKFVNYSGHKVDGPETLAQLHQVFRSPSIETFVYYVTRPDGTIFVNRAISSGKVDEVAIGDAVFDSMFIDLLESGEGSKLYVAHNHPSGRTEYSAEDMAITRKIKDNFPRAFSGHVVIDHGKYIFIDKNLGTEQGEYAVSKVGQEQDWRTGLNKIGAPEDLGEYFDNVLRSKSHLHIVFLDKGNFVVAYELFNPKETKNIFKDIFDAKTRYGSTAYIVMGDSASVASLIENKALPNRPIDIIEVHGLTKFTSYQETGKEIPTLANTKSVFEPSQEYGRKSKATPELQVQYEQAKEFKEQYKLFRESVGKMKKHAKGFMAEELSDIPSFYWTTEASAVAPDVKAAEMGYESEEQLLGAIREAEAKKKKLIPFMKEAKEILDEENRYQRIIERGRKYGYKEGYKEAHQKTLEKIAALAEAKYQARFKQAEVDLLMDWQEAKLEQYSEDEKAELRQAHKEQIADVQSMKDAIVEYATEYLPKDLRGNLLTQVRDAKTTLNVIEAFQKIDELAEQGQRKNLIETLKESLKKIDSSQNIAIEYKQMLQELSDSLSFTAPRQETLERLQRTQDYIEREIEAGREVAMPKYIFEALRTLERVPVKDLSLEELEYMIDRVNFAIELGQTKLRARQFMYEADKARIMRELTVANLNKFETRDRLEGVMSHVPDWFLLLNKARAPMDHFFFSMGDEAHRIFKEGMDSKYSVYLKFRRALEEKTDALIVELGLDADNMENIGIYAADQQEGGRAKLLNQYTEAEINAVKLDAKEKKFYDFMRSELEAIRPQYEKMLREVFNLPLGKVVNYFPFLSDFEAMSDWEIRDRFANLAEFDPQLRKKVDLGSQKQRIDRIGVQKIRVDAANVFMNHMDDVFYAVHLAEEIKKLQEVARSSEYGEIAGNIGQEVTRQWLDVMARKGGRSQRKTGFDRGVDWLRKNLSVSQLAFNPTSIALQLTATMDGAMLIGNYAFTGQPLAYQSNWRNFALDNSPQLKNRVGDDFAYREFGKTWWGEMQSGTMTPQKAIDGITATGVWIGAYNKYLDENNFEMDFGNPHREAVDYANRILTMTQASGSFKDLPVSITRAVGTGGNEAIAKALAQYQTFAFFRWANVSDIMPKLLKEKNYQEASQILTWWTAANLSEIAIRHGIKGVIGIMFMALLGGKGDFDEDEPSWTKLIDSMFGNIPYISNFISAIKYKDAPLAIVSAFNKTMEAWENMERSKKPLKKATWVTIAAMRTAGLFGAPTGQAVKMIRQADRAISENPFDKHADRDGKTKSLYNKFKKIRTEINSQHKAVRENAKAFDEKHRSRVYKLNSRINSIELLIRNYNKRGSGDASNIGRRLEELVKEYES